MRADVHQTIPNLNELAHDRARDLTRRGGMEALWGQDEIQINDPLLTFNEITSHYRLSRRAYPLPHPKLERYQSVTLRMLQTGSFPSRGFLSRISTEIYSSCPDCNETYCSLAHMLWQCPALPNGPLSSEADWEEALQSPSLHTQIQAIQRAQERAEHHGVPAPTWTRPAVSVSPH
uniref:Metabotropic glutamate receptor 1 n=1 Tax=Rhipicephalus appendiculatus TaxID=34631 RepID=A0A131YYR7_RHIAP